VRIASHGLDGEQLCGFDTSLESNIALATE
jgi:hypothetical protein